jgi:hypothetical protein
MVNIYQACECSSMTCMFNKQPKRYDARVREPTLASRSKRCGGPPLHIEVTSMGKPSGAQHRAALYGTAQHISSPLPAVVHRCKQQLGRPPPSAVPLAGTQPCHDPCNIYNGVRRDQSQTFELLQGPLATRSGGRGGPCDCSNAVMSGTVRY